MVLALHRCIPYLRFILPLFFEEFAKLDTKQTAIQQIRTLEQLVREPK
jgi:hypothetical protein